MKKKTMQLMLLGMSDLSMGLCACASKVPYIDEPGLVLYEEDNSDSKVNSEIEFQSSNTDEENEAISDAMNRFAFRMYDKMYGEENELLSPYSIAMAMSVLTNGANGETKQELMDVLGITDIDTWNNFCEETVRQTQSEDAKVCLANSLWFSDQLKLKKDADQNYIKPMMEKYCAEIETLNFSKNSSLGKINKWVSKNTEGMIDPFLSNLNPELKLCIANAIYFEGIWTNQFDETDTTVEEFTGREGSQQVDMMKNYEYYYKYFSDETIKGIEMPYGEDERIAMDVFLTADASKSIIDVMAAMSEDEKIEMLQKLSASKTTKIHRLSLPKFTFETDLQNISQPFKELGINAAFDEWNADFDIIANDLYLSNIYHKAKIIVDEKGTRAAAVTASEFETCEAVVDEEFTCFDVDHTFFYCIRDTSDNRILFMGYMDSIRSE